MKNLLVDVEADAENGMSDKLTEKKVLDQDTADFLLFPVHIVRPFDGYVPNIALECTFYAQRGDLCDPERFVRRQRCRMIEQAERKILSGFLLPRVAGLSAAGRLEIRDHDRLIGRYMSRLQLFLQIPVRRVRFPQTDDGRCFRDHTFRGFV